jgi:hypothetical protein
VGVSRIRLTIDRIVLNGFHQVEAKALANALESQLSQVLADRATRQAWAHSHRTPVLTLGPMTRAPGTTGAQQFGRRLGSAVGRGLKP